MKFSARRRRVRYVSTLDVAAILAREARQRSAGAAAPVPPPRPQTLNPKPSPAR